jgi:hypothetical protein
LQISENGCGGDRKKLKAVKELKVEHPLRRKISEQEALERMKELSKRKEQFIGLVRMRKVSDSVSALCVRRSKLRLPTQAGIKDGTRLSRQIS